ncbi:basic salivary proline-rich protein 2-like [Mustela putorius furo]|uniref:Basic salivary proline-rich protein 2-like n=1 Tax=Mustela putorius furo TaxID=9669 RepID=A0A8U0SCQ9_MUSPF|nr:basic salivary proline-rich protein 2-like [Mustela putorius furo]
MLQNLTERRAAACPRAGVTAAVGGRCVRRPAPAVSAAVTCRRARSAARDRTDGPPLGGDGRLGDSGRPEPRLLGRPRRGALPPTDVGPPRCFPLDARSRSDARRCSGSAGLRPAPARGSRSEGRAGPGVRPEGALAPAALALREGSAGRDRGHRAAAAPQSGALELGRRTPKSRRPCCPPPRRPEQPRRPPLPPLGRLWGTEIKRKAQEKRPSRPLAGGGGDAPIAGAEPTEEHQEPEAAGPAEPRAPWGVSPCPRVPLSAAGQAPWSGLQAPGKPVSSCPAGPPHRAGRCPVAVAVAPAEPSDRRTRRAERPQDPQSRATAGPSRARASPSARCLGHSSRGPKPGSQ